MQLEDKDKTQLARLIVGLISYLGVRDQVYRMLRGY